MLYVQWILIIDVMVAQWLNKYRTQKEDTINQHNYIIMQ